MQTILGHPTAPSRAPAKSQLGGQARTLANVLAVLCISTTSAVTSAQVRVVTTTPGYADIVKQVGGEHVQVESVMRGPENVHNVVPKPSYMMKLRKADLFIHSGLDAEGWVPQLIQGARRSHLLPGEAGNVDVSREVQLKEVPTRAQLTRALGDIHVYGNPHYALDPLNGTVIARTITDALKQTDSAYAETFEKNYEAYAKRLRELTQRLVAEMKPYSGTAVVVYHRTWPYFLNRFGLARAAEIEPKPGIAPGPGHLSQCVATMKARGTKVVIIGTYDNKKNAEFISRRGGGKVVLLAQEVRAVPEVDSYEKLFEYNVRKLLRAFKELGIAPKESSGDAAPDSNGQTSSRQSVRAGENL